MVGQNAAKIAVGWGTDVFIYDRSIDRLRELDTISTAASTPATPPSLEIQGRLPDR